MFKVSNLRNVDDFRLAAYLTAGELNLQAPRLLQFETARSQKYKKRITFSKIS